MEDFVTFEIAKKLKEKGFNLGVYRYYENKVLKWSNSPWLEPKYNDYREHIIAAPTISQALKWLRKEKKIHICVDFDGYMNWYYQIAIYGSTDIAAAGYGYNDYEIAALAGIECVLNNFI